MLPRYSLPVINIVASQLISRRRRLTPNIGVPPIARSSMRPRGGAENIVAGMCTSITTRMKLHTIELELERLDVCLRGPFARNSGSQAQVIEHYFATAGSCIA